MPYVKSDRSGVLYIRGIPRHIKDLFKSWCFRRGITMTKAIEGFMKDKVVEERRSTKNNK
jgi:hypothetical protein